MSSASRRRRGKPCACLRLGRVGQVVQLGVCDERIAQDRVELGLRARAIRYLEQVDVGVGLVEEAFLHPQTVAAEVQVSYADPRRKFDDDLARNEALRLQRPGVVGGTRQHQQAQREE